MSRFLIAVVAVIGLTASAASANEFELSFYTGYQSAPHANVSGSDPGNSVDEDVDFTPAWEGRPFDAPPYYGIRGTWWRTETLGFGLELNHAKVYADEDDAADNGFSRLEFTDGLNIITVNAFRRWPNQFGDWTPYVGGGVGVAFPHVDVESDGGKTFEYQLTGPAVMWAAGASYPINDRWDGFVEYKGTYSQNTADLDNGGELDVDFVTNAINLGLTFNF
ncbi:outer membrane protein [Shimia ponticola]|uniref:outer membrane protein n=1 Tax=Shimia ponticola TaxID=2582893 RepID=UPI0011BDCFAB|nr:outer membrane beta-barrel protein [Shimia ponticola]